MFSVIQKIGLQVVLGLLIFNSTLAFAGHIGGNPGRRVLALVVGVSDYKDPEINDLRFSDTDALAFYNYLTGKAGGEVDTNNIRLLLNERATVANIYNAKRWLETSARKGDLVFVYFAGHGDRENSIYQLGFLLAHDTPHKNYLNNAMRIEDFNDMATTLSVKTGAEVVIITDACHSGTLSGIDKARQTSLVQEQLIQAKKNEVRIASCEPDQLSQEDEVWGGGRGLFSYFFLYGLKGLADADNDGMVSLGELKKYVSSSLSQQVVQYDLEDQNPVIEGNEGKLMSLVVDSVKQKALTSLENPTDDNVTTIRRSVSAINMPWAGRFLSPVRKQNLLTTYDFYSLKKSGTDAFLNLILDAYGTGQESGMQKYLNLAVKDGNYRSELRQELAAVIHDQVQDLINIYLAGDEARMEERRYYNSRLPGYDEVVPMIEVAMNMLDNAHPLYRILEIKKYYFEGLVARLKTPTAPDPQALIDEAYDSQLKAYRLEPKAAYVVNELGVLSLYKGQVPKAVKYFNDATGLSIKWAIPYANLSHSYRLSGDNGKAMEYALKARDLKPDLELAAYNLGDAYLTEGNLLLAEETFQKSIFQNNRHFYPFEKLGDLYSSMTEYERADSFYYESALRKLKTNFDPNAETAFSFYVVAAPHLFLHDCVLDTNSIDSRDYMAFFYWGYVYHYDKGRNENAIKIWHKAIDADLDNPMIYHYLGRAYYNLGRYREAEFMFNNAIKYYLDKQALATYLDNDEARFGYTTIGDRICLKKEFLNWFYKGRDNDFLLAQLYENWHHYDEAAQKYRYIIDNDTLTVNQKNALVALMTMYEKLEQWESAESFIQEYDWVDYDFFENELAGFYNRAAVANPSEGRWWYSRGMLLSEMVEDGMAHLMLDSIIWHPKTNREYFVNLDFLQDSFHMVKDVYKDLDSIEVGSLLQRAAKEDNTLMIDATNRYLTIQKRSLTLKKDAIEAFRMALPLHDDASANADIQFRIAELFVRAGSHRQAFPYYQEATKKRESFASYRMGAVTSGTVIYENAIVYDHLQRLAADTTLNHPLSVQLARFSLMAGDHQDALKMVDNIDVYYPFYLPEKKLYPALVASWQNKYTEAVSFFASILADEPGDPETLYSMALMYGKNNKFSDAKTFLNRALDAGFNYVFVLHAEPLWKRVFGPAHWRKAIKVKRTPKAYEKSDLLKAYY